ncbi:MAG: hypothetical protein HY890_05585 [Deltaproteobacteria bacterium]|nr:hypothetical protein [Deltaproteobacteria bacterium]
MANDRKKAVSDYEDRPEGISARVLDEHRSLWKSVKKKLVRGLKESDEKELKLAKLAGDTLMDVVKGERQAWGINDDELDAACGAADGIAAEMERLTVPPPADKALDRG